MNDGSIGCKRNAIHKLCIRIVGKHTYTYYYMHTFCTCIVQKFNKSKVFSHLIIITVQVVVDDTVIHKLKQRFNNKAKIE